MAIAFDLATTGSSTGSSDTLTFSHTCTGDDRILFVEILTSENSPGDPVVGVTYNGDAMTRVAGATLIDYAPGNSFLTYFIVNPDAGANDVEVTFQSGAVGDAWAAGLSYTGASQTGQPDGFNAIDHTGEIPITIVANGSWMLSGGRNRSSGGISPDTNVTERTDASVGGLFNWGDSNGPLSPGTNTQIWDPNDTNTTLVATSFAPAAGAAATGNMFLVM